MIFSNLQVFDLDSAKPSVRSIVSSGQTLCALGMFFGVGILHDISIILRIMGEIAAAERGTMKLWSSQETRVTYSVSSAILLCSCVVCSDYK